MPAPTTIAFYTDSTSVGGAEMVLGTLLHELDPGLGVVVAGVSSPVVETVAQHRAGSRTVVLEPVTGKRDFRAMARNVRAIRQLGAAIFQANLNVPAACQYALAAATVVRGVQTVAVEHLPYPLDGRLQLLLKQFTSRRLAAHVAVGERVARQVEQFAALRTGAIRTIYNGVADLALEPVRRAEGRVVLGTIGRLDRQKGMDILLRAMSRLPEAHLTLVGDGEERSALEQLATELGVAERVRFAGSRSDARRYLTAFDVFVLPSRFEGFPLAIIEAMLASLPVVASAVGSVPEAVLQGRTGLLVPVEDPEALAGAIARLLENPELRARMGAAGRERALHFTPASMARAYERLYQELLG